MKFTNIGKRLTFIFGVTTLSMLTLFFVSYWAFGSLSQRWEQYRDVSLQKYEAAYRLRMSHTVVRLGNV